VLGCGLGSSTTGDVFTRLLILMVAELGGRVDADDDLPTARTTLSMAVLRRDPERLRAIHPR